MKGSLYLEMYSPIFSYSDEMPCMPPSLGPVPFSFPPSLPFVPVFSLPGPVAAHSSKGGLAEGTRQSRQEL